VIRSRTLGALALAAAALAFPSSARALDFRIKGEALRLDLTESMYLAAHLDDGSSDVTTLNYGELLNRLYAQLAWRHFLFSVRFDSGAWFHTPDANSSLPSNPLCQTMPPDPSCVVRVDPTTGQITDGRLVHQQADPSAPNGTAYVPYRFLPPGTVVWRGRQLDRKGNVVSSGAALGVSAFYLEKIALTYSDRNIEATLGDFYVNLGRGLVLSIRKIDELGVDTTLSGAKVVIHRGNFGAVALAGWSNMQNIDQAQAQWIEDSNDLLSALHVDYRFFDRILIGAHGVFGWPFHDTACPVAGDSSCNKPHDYYLRPGVMLDAPRLFSWLGLYAEYAREQDRVGTAPQKGNAFYGALTAYAGRTTWLLETKWYDNYQPWHASNDPFGNLVYTVPPTLERVITQINNNTDILAGRLRLDVRATDLLNVYASVEVGRSHPAGPTSQDSLVDAYFGAEVRWDEGRSHFFPFLGYRAEHDDIADALEEHLVAVEWDGAQYLGRGLSVETSGLIWFREKPVSSAVGWREGNVYVSLKWSPRLVASLGYEFTTLVDATNSIHNFFNGALTWNITPATSLGVFAGGNRPGLKCISGVCRVFPAFQGARLELTLRL